MIGRILCALGFHRWRPYKAMIVRVPDRTDHVVTYSRCTRCGDQDHFM